MSKFSSLALRKWLNFCLPQFSSSLKWGVIVPNTLGGPEDPSVCHSPPLSPPKLSGNVSLRVKQILITVLLGASFMDFASKTGLD